jgi:hypothetical protein
MTKTLFLKISLSGPPFKPINALVSLAISMNIPIFSKVMLGFLLKSNCTVLGSGLLARMNILGIYWNKTDIKRKKIVARMNLSSFFYLFLRRSLT